MLFPIYRAAYQGAGWIIKHSGPMEPVLIRVAGQVHDRLIPRSYYDVNPVTVDGLRIYHDGYPVLARSLATGMYEAETTRLLKRLLVPGMTALDVGANIGYFSLLLARLVGPSGAVWAFEPTPQANELLHKNVVENRFDDRVHIVPRAVSSTPGVVRLYINAATSSLSSIYQEAAAYQHGAQPVRSDGIDVACTSLDAWAAEQEWPSVDLIKMDVEGAEKSALEGMVELSHRNPRLRLMLEFNARTLRAAGATVEDFFATLNSRGFDRISVIGESLQLLHMPTDIPVLLRKIHQHSGEGANLLCEKTIS